MNIIGKQVNPESNFHSGFAAGRNRGSPESNLDSGFSAGRNQGALELKFDSRFDALRMELTVWSSMKIEKHRRNAINIRNNQLKSMKFNKN
eukprot:12425440-Karenia_brevis.AAC.2